MNWRARVDALGRLFAAKDAIASTANGLVATAAAAIFTDRISPGWVILSFVAFSVLFSLIGGALNRWWPKAEITPRLGPAPLKRGLIVLVSPGKTDSGAALGAIKHHFRGERDERPAPTLEYLWLICSREYEAEPKESNSSYKNAQILKQRYKEHLRDVFVMPVADPDSPSAVFNVLDTCYREAARLHMKEEEVMADLTGGTKSMSVGMAYAAIPTTRDLQFMKPRGYSEDGRADATVGADAQSIDVDFVERLPWFTKSR